MKVVMKVIVLILPLCISQFLQAQITGPQPMGATVQQQPPDYLGYLDLNGILPLKFAPSPNDAAFEAKYWLSKSPRLQNSLGFGWQIGFNESYAKSDTDFSIDGQTGKELAYLYNYLSVRYKVMKGKHKIRPYAEVGSGWLFMNHNFVERSLNPEYDPDHSCPDNDEYLRETTSIRAQHRLALDVEAGLNVQLTDNVSLNVGVGSIISNKVGHLEEAYQSAFLENVSTTPSAYQFSNNPLHSVSLKIGVSIQLVDRPFEGEPSHCCCEEKSDSVFLIDFTESSSCNN